MHEVGCVQSRPAVTPIRKSDQPDGPEIASTVIRPPVGWQAIDLREFWIFRELLYFLVWRDVKVRYKQTLLGAAWAILQPGLMMVVFTIFFSRMAGVSSGGLPYPLFAYAGLLPWTFFATAVTNSGNSVVGAERLITKIYFPRLIVPFAAVGAAMVDFVMAMALLVGLMVFYGITPGWSILLMPVLLGMITLLALGLGSALAALNVAYRDFRYVIPFLIQLGMFATPTVYMQPESVPALAASDVYEGSTPSATPVGGGDEADEVQSTTRADRGWLGFLLILNPMTPLIGAFRAAVLGGPIAWGAVATAAVTCVVVFVLACLYFRRVEDSFADII